MESTREQNGLIDGISARQALEWHTGDTINDLLFFRRTKRVCRACVNLDYSIGRMYVLTSWPTD